MDKFVLCLSPHLSWIDGSSNIKSSKQYKTIRSTFYNNRLVENKLLQLITREQTNARRLCTAIITHGIIIDNFAPAQNPFIDLV